MSYYPRYGCRVCGSIVEKNDGDWCPKHSLECSAMGCMRRAGDLNRFCHRHQPRLISRSQNSYIDTPESAESSKCGLRLRLICRNCSKIGEMLKCSHCGTPYCSRLCQKIDWKASHKNTCKLIRKRAIEKLSD